MTQFKDLSEDTKQKLRDAGREDLIKIHKANIEGYAGCLPSGMLVDRREHPEAYPVMGNPMLNTAPAKQLENDPHADWFERNQTTI